MKKMTTIEYMAGMARDGSGDEKMTAEDIKKEKRKSYLKVCNLVIKTYGGDFENRVWDELCKTSFSPNTEHERILISEDEEMFQTITDIYSQLTIRMVP